MSVLDDGLTRCASLFVPGAGLPTTPLKLIFDTYKDLSL